MKGKNFFSNIFKYFQNRRTLRKHFLKFIIWFEKGAFFSKSLRLIFEEYYGVKVGMYTHGGCFVPGNFDRETVIGRYCSIAMTANAANRNHPLELKSMHAFFFNPRLGFCQKDPVEYTALQIGNDVWIGHNAIIMPNVRTIGDGAVIGAGCIVNKDIPPYAVVVGNPGRIVRYRFSEEKIKALLEEKWWEKDIQELAGDIGQFQKILEKASGEGETSRK